MNTFIDTSAFFAFLDADDQFHEKARTAFVKLIKLEKTLHCSNYIIIETIALLQNRININAVRAFEDKILAIMNIHWVDERMHDIAISNLLTAKRKNVSLIDYTTFEIMRALGIKKVFTFDDHFREQGFQAIIS